MKTKQVYEVEIAAGEIGDQLMIIKSACGNAWCLMFKPEHGGYRVAKYFTQEEVEQMLAEED